MADPIAVATRQVTRDKLAQFLKSQELIKLFENLTQDVSVTVPEALDTISAVADQALATGLLVMGVAESARAEADRLTQVLNRVDAAFSTQRDRGAELQELRKRLDAIENTVVALGRGSNTDTLRKQIEELRALVIGS